MKTVGKLIGIKNYWGFLIKKAVFMFCFFSVLL